MLPTEFKAKLGLSTTVPQSERLRRELLATESTAQTKQKRRRLVAQYSYDDVEPLGSEAADVLETLEPSRKKKARVVGPITDLTISDDEFNQAIFEPVLERCTQSVAEEDLVDVEDVTNQVSSSSDTSAVFRIVPRPTEEDLTRAIIPWTAPIDIRPIAAIPIEEVPNSDGTNSDDAGSIPHEDTTRLILTPLKIPDAAVVFETDGAAAEKAEETVPVVSHTELLDLEEAGEAVEQPMKEKTPVQAHSGNSNSESSTNCAASNDSLKIRLEGQTVDEFVRQADLERRAEFATIDEEHWHSLWKDYEDSFSDEKAALHLETAEKEIKSAELLSHLKASVIFMKSVKKSQKQTESEVSKLRDEMRTRENTLFHEKKKYHTLAEDCTRVNQR
ncbi:hypothetical protein ACET3Z_001683 [Daucus carota]